MGRKRVLKLAKVVSLKCPNCSAISKRKVPDNSPMYFDCDKCQAHIVTPITQCCIICAYTNKKCLPALKQLAFSKDLELRI